MESVLLLILQFFLSLGTLHVHKEVYVVRFNNIFACYMLIEIVSQTACIITSIILLFYYENIVIFVFFGQLLLACLIETIFEIISAKKSYSRLKMIIIKDELLDMEPKSIKRHILEKYGFVYNDKEIVKAVRRLYSTKGRKKWLK